MKRRSSSGGSGVHVWAGRLPRGFQEHTAYLQEFIEGEPCAAIFVGDGRAARLLGVTRQLVGESWLHARPFHYCGSVGRIPLEPEQRQAFDRLGSALAAGCRLRGLFGVDCILRGDGPWPVEVNPRYTASVEVLEYALGVPALALHRRAFDAGRATGFIPAEEDGRDKPGRSPGVIGKAVLFARASLVFPSDGPWLDTLRQPAAPEELPAFADIPPAGQPIKVGRPVLTFFARGDSPHACRDALRQTARDLDRWLFG